MLTKCHTSHQTWVIYRKQRGKERRKTQSAFSFYQLFILKAENNGLREAWTLNTRYKYITVKLLHSPVKLRTSVHCLQMYTRISDPPTARYVPLWSNTRDFTCRSTGGRGEGGNEKADTGSLHLMIWLFQFVCDLVKTIAVHIATYQQTNTCIIITNLIVIIQSNCLKVLQLPQIPQLQRAILST